MNDSTHSANNSAATPRFSLRWVFFGVTGFCLVVAYLAACGASPVETGLALGGSLLTGLLGIGALEGIGRLSGMFEHNRDRRLHPVMWYWAWTLGRDFAPPASVSAALPEEPDHARPELSTPFVNQPW